MTSFPPSASIALQHLQALHSAFAKVSDWTESNLEQQLKATAQSLGCKTGELIHPTRVAVSGRTVGPSLYAMLEVLGRDRVLQRLEQAQKL